jgi:ADP-heptose:LPS heptosyltransferase
MKTIEKVIIIKHGALGDLINALGAFSVIRRNHPKAKITFITAPAYKKFAEATGFFDEILIDRRQRFFQDFFAFRPVLKQADRVYDLQNSKRTSLYFQLLKPGRRPEWNGIAPGCSHLQDRPDRVDLHAASRFADQLAKAGLDLFGQEELLPDLSWLKVEVDHFALPEKSILVMPGSSKTGSYKRWPASYYGDFCNEIYKRGYMPVLIAGPDDQDATEIIRRLCPSVRDLSLKTSFFEIAGLARHAIATVGNDTGPVHLAAAAQCPTLVLWSKASPPDVYAPRGLHVKVLYQEDLKDLPLDRVMAALFGHVLKEEPAKAV